MNDFLEIHLPWIRESNLIEGIDDEIADRECFDAWRRFTEGAINRRNLLRCHWDVMFRLNRRIAGDFRKCNVRVGWRVCPDWKQVPNLMRKWFERHGAAKTAEAIKTAHIEFEKIHPFEDGNGRVGRMVMNHQRVKAGLDVLVIYAKERQEYYKWFMDVDEFSQSFMSEMFLRRFRPQR